MNQSVNPSLLVEETGAAAPPQEPKVFVRTLAAPPGAPWSQTRVARLEARLGAPMPIGDLLYQLRRLESWRPGQAGKFGAFYVRAQEVGDRLATTLQVDGQSIAVEFLSVLEQRRRARLALLGSLISAAFAAVVFAAFVAALGSRLDSEARLSRLELNATRELRAVKAQDALKAQARALGALNLQNRRISDFFNDLNWASAAKTQDAHVQALHWTRGFLAVEVRGETPPFARADRTIIRAPKPLRPGLWLWGVKPPQAFDASVTPYGRSDSAGPGKRP